MDGTKKPKGGGSAGRSPSKDNIQNRPGANTPAKSTTAGLFKPMGKFTQGPMNTRSNADDLPA